MVLLQNCWRIGLFGWSSKTVQHNYATVTFLTFKGLQGAQSTLSNARRSLHAAHSLHRNIIVLVLPILAYRVRDRPQQQNYHHPAATSIISLLAGPPTTHSQTQRPLCVRPPYAEYKMCYIITLRRL